jgi:hypothetical protein
MPPVGNDADHDTKKAGAGAGPGPEGDPETAGFIRRQAEVILLKQGIGDEAGQVPIRLETVVQDRRVMMAHRHASDATNLAPPAARSRDFQAHILGLFVSLAQDDLETELLV